MTGSVGESTDDFIRRAVAWIRARLAAPTDEARDAVGELSVDAAHGLPLLTMADRFGLSPFERDIVLLGAAVELDPSLRDLCATLHGNSRLRHPSFAVALLTLPDRSWDAWSPDRPLRALRLVQVDPAPDESLVTAPLRLDERVLNHIRGIDHLDVRLRATALPVPVGEPVGGLPPSQRAVVDRVVAAWAGAAEPVTVELVGPDRAALDTVAAAACGALDLWAYRLSARSLPAEDAALADLAVLWSREAGLTPTAVLLDDADAVDVAVGFTRRCSCPCLVLLQRAPTDSPPGALRLDVHPPTVQERRSTWAAHLPPGSTADPARLAVQFAVGSDAIARIAATAPDPWQACRESTRPRLDGLARRIEPEASWNDLVLADESLRQLHAITDQMRNRWQVHHEWSLADRSTRGLGIAAMFTGPSGTGKTLAAEVIAHDLSLDLYSTDLSGIVSKYIGETEKNLRQLFDAAEAGGAVLFIDEADALFGKRSDVHDSHDRFANIQIDYLLQRLESFGGLAILATNLRGAIDAAFTRRLRFIVEFGFPEPAQREAIWRANLVPTLPGSDTLDPAALADWPLSGAMIRNVTVNAAFLAAAEGSALTRDHLRQAARDEFAKLQIPISDRQLAGGAVTP